LCFKYQILGERFKTNSMCSNQVVTGARAWCRSPYSLGIINNEVPPEWHEAMSGAPPRQVAYACVRPGSIVWGRVISCRPAVLFVEILSVVACDVDGVRPKRWSFSESEQVAGSCSNTEARDGSNPVLATEFPVGTPVLATVLSVIPVIGHIILSMKSSKLPRREALFPPYRGNWGSMEHGLPALGHAGHTAPEGPRAEDWEEERVRNAPTPYLTQLERDCDFGSPHSLRAAQRAFRLQEGWSVVGGGGRSAEAAGQLRDYLDDVKAEVREAWATESVRRGVSHAKGGDYATALKCYEQALELDAHHKDAYVARGAALANQHRFRDAAADFERALEIDSSDENAKKYLAAIREKHPEACKRLSASRKALTPSEIALERKPSRLGGSDARVAFEGKGAQVGIGDGSGGSGSGDAGISSAGGVAEKEYDAELERELAAAVEERKRRKKEKDRDREKEKSKKEKSKSKKKSKKRRRSSSSDSERE